MKTFHISDVLTVTTGRLVSSRHMDGVYEILNFLTSDNLYTHQLPRAMNECRPWLKSQFPTLMDDSPGMSARLADLDRQIASVEQTAIAIAPVIAAWVEALRISAGLPELIPVCELGADMHLHIDLVDEARAMMGDGSVIVVEAHDSNS